MSTFKSDRDLVVDLTDKDAHTVLGLLDGGTARNEAPPELQAALAAAHRSPDVSRYFLVEKTQNYVAWQFPRRMGGERRALETRRRGV
jgi:hypothetical protein